MNCVLSIAGSDSGGASGIQADVKAVAAHGGHAVTVVTAVTAQGRNGVEATMPVPVDVVAAQLEAARSAFEITAVKSGMFLDEERVETVARAFQAWRPPNYVIDPVIVSSSGHALLSPVGIDAAVRELFPLAALVTPNVGEAERLSGRRIASLTDVHAAGEIILRHGCGAVLIKGGHLDAAPATDVLIHADGTHIFKGAFTADTSPRGTGCTLSAVVATLLGQGQALLDAVPAAKAYVARAIQHCAETGSTLIDHFHALRGR